jgi:hypothetical protein
LHGSTFTSEGFIIPIEVAGPPGYDYWLKSYQCLRTALISWKAVRLGRLDLYASLIKRYVSRYGATVWYQIYQAETRCRGEHMERVRRRGEEERAIALAAGTAHPMDPTCPWDWVWGQALVDANFWRMELEEPALLMLTRNNRAPQADVASPGPGKLLLVDDMPGAQPQKIAKFHDVDGDVFKSNRKGKSLCAAFNQGSCAYSATSMICPKNPSEMHQCSRCLDPSHGAQSCRRSDYPAQQNSWSGAAKGKGKGKHQGKGKHKGRRQY